MSRYFDQIFCISLARREDRWRSVSERLRRWGLEAERIVAVDGSGLVTAAAPASGYRSRATLSPGELGCLLSHRRAIELARERGTRRVLVLEDDVCLHRRFGERLKELDAIGHDWDLLYLGASQYRRRGRKFLNAHCYRARGTLGTFAYAMRDTLFERFLRLTADVTRPADAALARLQDDPAIRCLVCDPPLAIADVRESDLRPARSLERHAARMGWALGEFEISQWPVASGQLSVAGGQLEDGGGGRRPERRPEGEGEHVGCRFRSGDGAGGTICGHPRVHAGDGVVTREICDACTLREAPSESLSEDFAVGRPCGPGAVRDGLEGRATSALVAEEELREGLGRPSSGAGLSRSERAIIGAGLSRSERATIGASLSRSERAIIGAGLSRSERATMGSVAARPRTLLAIDRFGWAFHADAEGLVKHLKDEFAFTIVPHRELARYPEMVEGDLLVAFWWQSLLGIDTSRVGAVVCGLFDTWSWDVHGAGKLQAALDKASVLLVANEYILDDLRNHPAGFRPPAVFVCEEGVDCELFRPQPFPTEFRVGWAGTTANARGFRGARDGKGLGLIEEAARLAGVRLVAACSRQIAHEAMPAEYYRHVSAQCVGSYSEGAPLTVAEALACGRPVITTNVGIVPRLVQHGVNGLIAPREAKALADAMREMRRLGPEAMSAAARRSALLYDWSRQAPKWAHCFRSALELAGRRTQGRIAARPEFAAGEWQTKRFGTG